MAKLRQVIGARVAIPQFFSARMYYFKYLASETSDIYNMFPLMINLRKKGQRLEGIDLHYLTVKQRIILLKSIKLLDEKLNNNIMLAKTIRQRLWNLHDFRFGAVAYRRYKISNISSAVIEVDRGIDYGTWFKEVEKHTEWFVRPNGKKVSKGFVWKKTFQRIKRR